MARVTRHFFIVLLLLPLALLMEGLQGTSPVASAASTAGPAARQDVFERGQDSAVWQRTFDGAQWGSWARLGGVINAEPAAVYSGNGRIDVFVRGQDQGFWQKTWNGAAWTDWSRLGGTFTSAPAAASWGQGRIDLFGVGVDAQLWHRSWDGSSWSGWTALGGVLTSSPAAASWGPGRIDVFARGQDNAIWHRSFDNGAWSSWASIGGVLLSAPAAASWTAGRLDVFARGQDSAVWHKWFDAGGWSGWQWLGGVLTSDPSASSSGLDRVEVFARGQDNGLWEARWDGNRWVTWVSLGGVLIAGTDPIVSWVPVYKQTMNLDCETAALQMALASKGAYYSQSYLFGLEVVDLSPPVMGANKTVLRWGDPYVNFVGDVNGSDIVPTGYGIYWPPIQSIARSHGAPQATGGEGYSPKDVYQALATGHPVQVWVETGWQVSPYRGIWTAWDGRPIRYSLIEHTVVLSGLTTNFVRINDPWHGTQYWISKVVFERYWADFNNMALFY